jgi:type VI protein secretion system component Hcp
MERTMAKNKSIEKTRELTEAELNLVSGGKPSAAPKQDTFPTETIKFSYGAMQWTYTQQ